MTSSSQPGAHDDHAAEGFRHAFRERAISLRTMPRPLRLITGLAVAQVLAAALLLVLRDHGPQAPQVSVYVVDNQLVSVSVPVLVATIVLLALAWSYLVSGVLHAHRLVRVAALALFTWAMWHEGVVPHDRGIWTAGGIALLVAVWLIAVAAQLYDVRLHRRGRDDRSHMRRLVLLTFAAVFAVCGGMYALSYLAWAGTAPLLFTETLTAHLSAVSVLLVPVLYVAGVDFAEWAHVAGERTGHLVSRLRTPVVLLVVTALAAGATAGWAAYGFRGHIAWLGQEVLAGVVALALVLLLARGVRLARSTGLPHHVPYAAVVALAVVAYGVTYLSLYLPGEAHAEATAKTMGGRIEADMGPYNHEGDPAFSVEHPVFWPPTVDADRPDGLTVVHFDGTRAGDPAVFEVVTAPTSMLPDTAGAVTAVLSGLAAPHGPLAGHVAYLASAHRQGAWEVFEVGTYQHDSSARPMQARMWARIDGDRAWVLIGFTFRSVWSVNAAAFDATATSWQASPRVETPAATKPAAGPQGISDSDRALLIEVGATVLLAMLLLAATRRRWSPKVGGAVATAAMFAGSVAVFETLASLGVLAHAASGSDRGLVGLHIDGVQVLAGAGCLVWLGAVAWRRRVGAASRKLLPAALALVVGLQVISWIYDLYNGVEAAGRFSIAQAVILVLALLWDITMSGEAVTNGSNRWFPRHARVSLYFGYVILVVAAILYYSSLRLPAGGGAVEPQFESDVWPQAGLVILGVPLLVTLFAMRVASWWRDRGAQAAPMEEAA